MPTLTVLAITWTLVAPATQVAKPQVCYVTSAATKAFEKPSPTARSVNAYKAMSIVEVLEGTKGWAKVKPFTDTATSEAEGWIAAQPEYLIADGCFEAVLRRVRTEEHKWPTATKRDVIAQKIKIGFTKNHVQIALGDPAAKSSEETSTGVTEVWAYADRAITFKGDKVTTIRKVE